MSRRRGTGLDLKLNLSPPPRVVNTSHPRAVNHDSSPNRSSTVSPTSPPSSCISSEMDESLRHSSSPEATSMRLVGCPKCLMYVMLSAEDPRCPKCKSTVLLDFAGHDNNNDVNGTKKTKKF